MFKCPTVQLYTGEKMLILKVKCFTVKYFLQFFKKDLFIYLRDQTQGSVGCGEGQRERENLKQTPR